MSWLNIRHISTQLPEEFQDVYSPEKYQTSQEYLLETTQFSIIQSSIHLILTIPFIILGGFNYIDTIARNISQGPIVTGVIFFGLLIILSQLLSLPFSIYHTFVIEKKYQFNTTTPQVFIADLLKGMLLLGLLGIPVLTLILWFFETTGSHAWLWCWGATSTIQLILLYISPILIMPLFNKFTPLKDTELHTAISDYAKQVSFNISGIYTMDGSKRSTKSNAFFTGFGKFKRVVLFDTLIKNHSIDELVAIVAHEVGHYKKKHIFKHMLISLATSGAMFYLLSLFIKNPGLFQAFKMTHISTYASLVFFSFLFSPIEAILSIISNILSRKHEYEADHYATSTTPSPNALITGLKKLSVDNLSNLTPHPLKVFLEYSHPPVLARINAIKRQL